MSHARHSAALAAPARGTWLDLRPAEAVPVLAGLRILDVRQPDEFRGELGHVPGSELLPLDRLEQALDSLDPRTPLLIVCRSGKRAAAACERLASAGFDAVYNLEGGMIAWNAEGRPTCDHPHDDVGGDCQAEWSLS
ncbi:MAG: rhodanese-like domain-containing protein [Deltaproteobacteria bacterium]|nr:rhodanese-like domain-containing protein [Deltaproteobacteria bacterium]MCB9787995.1 rhodanese-like domain-containing protein [Deltaproteobacteria bacterium]